MSILNFTLTTEQMKEISYNEGLEDGRAEGMSECARKMKSEGIDFSVINSVTGYSIAAIEAL